MTNTSLFRRTAVVMSALAIAGSAGWYALRPTAAQKPDAPSKEFTSVAGKPSDAPDMDRPSMLLLNSARLDVASADAKSLRKAVDAFSGKRMHIVKYSGPIQSDWYKNLTETGVEVIDYIPNYAYLVYGDSSSLSRIQAASAAPGSPIEWEAEYKSDYRIQPSVWAESTDKNASLVPASSEFQIQLYRDDAVNAETLALIESLKISPIKGQQNVLRYTNLVVGLDQKGILAIADRPDVISIAASFPMKKLDERQDIIMTGDLTNGIPNPQNYLAYLTAKGFTQSQFTTSNFVVDVSDSGIDNGAPANPTQFLLRLSGDPASTSRIVYSRLEGTPNAGSTTSGCDGHGNLNATIVGGYVPDGGVFNAFPHADASGYRYGLGLAPFVKVGSSVIFDPDNFTNPNYPNLQSKAYNDNARISSNSWGAVSNLYTTDSQTYDALVRDAQPTGSTVPAAGNQEMVVVFAAGNAGSRSGTISQPGTAKNVITVGATENVHPFSAADGCGTADAEANSANDLVGFSSRGPTSDGRIKPDIVAPGTHVSGGVVQASVVSPVSGNGAQNTCFTASGLCAGPASNFWPLNQQWYSASSGTSHSTPAVAGVAALIRQHFINLGLTPPSPAMTKGLLMNSARYLTGTGANDDLYSSNQGMGSVNLNSYFDVFARGRILRDQVAADKFTATGQQRIFTGTIVDSTKPFRVTLAYTDAPGSTTGNAYVNNLDLEVTVGGQLYLGNVFTGGASTTGGTADARNNVESVFIPAGVTGNVVVRVKATNIAGDGVPNNADALDQDFALIITNANTAAIPFVQTNGIVQTAENGTPANNVPDPGETVTVTLELQNVGTATTGAVTATLLSTGGVTNPTAVQSFGTLGVGSAAVTRPFTFTVSPSVACGTPITLTFQISDGFSTSTVTKVFPTGTPVTGLTQNFDGVVLPALPAGWTQVQTSGTGITWSTSNNASSSAPNAAFANDPATVNASALVSPVFTVALATAQLSFQNNYNVEASSSTPTTGFDGVVLEISIAGGAFQDIITAGGSFVSGGYNRTISTCCSNPIAGRQAWSGNSGGFVPTVVNLPASANGQNVQLRWLMASDSSATGAGVFIDNVAVLAGNSCATVVNTVKSRGDFDGDGKTDVAVFRGSTQQWYLNRSTAGFTVATFGLSSDKLTPADWDGDGKADIAVFRPSATPGAPDFWILRSSDNSVATVEWGTTGDVAQVGDFDGDGKADAAIYRPAGNVWFILKSSGGFTSASFGASGDTPVAADYDGDGKTDIAVFRPSTNQWWISGSAGATSVQTFGTSGDKLVPADYDGDNKDDVAIFRPSTGDWWILQSSNGTAVSRNFGTSTDVPVPGDYDGDGKDDVAIFRPSTGDWWLNRSTAGVATSRFGLSSDIPVPTAYIP